MSDLDAMSDERIVMLIKSFEPHDEAGQPMIALHWDLWRRVLALADPPKEPLAPAKREACEWVADFLDGDCTGFGCVRSRCSDGCEVNGLRAEVTRLRGIVAAVESRVVADELRDTCGCEKVCDSPYCQQRIAAELSRALGGTPE